MPTIEEIINALKTVTDPEMHIDVHTLGLIYGITYTDTGVNIRMTLTTPLCPYADEIVSAVRDSVQALGVSDVSIDVTFDPPWDPPEGLRVALGL